MSADIAEEFGEDVAARCWTPEMLQSCVSHSLHIKEDIEIPFLLGEDSTSDQGHARGEHHLQTDQYNWKLASMTRNFFTHSAFDLGLYPTLKIHRSQRGRSGRDLKCLLSRKGTDLMPNTYV
jgi:hypothetical protein